MFVFVVRCADVCLLSACRVGRSPYQFNIHGCWGGESQTKCDQKADRVQSSASCTRAGWPSRHASRCRCEVESINSSSRTNVVSTTLFLYSFWRLGHPARARGAYLLLHGRVKPGRPIVSGLQPINLGGDSARRIIELTLVKALRSPRPAGSQQAAGPRRGNSFTATRRD